eukprot:TRINITY_DN1424_c0_g1_i3.p1 TRINITY_DN1424_c0_g1~~TRINITY_DN1424_c0_g1_i3.p1  ORF type:complete len:186 (-),score=31.88 TRINITY_DN1424_c0_g1_i3:132-689(-)
MAIRFALFLIVMVAHGTIAVRYGWQFPVLVSTSWETMETDDGKQAQPSEWNVNLKAKTPPTKYYINSDEALKKGESLLSPSEQAELRLDDSCKLSLIVGNGLAHQWALSEGNPTDCSVILSDDGEFKLAAQGNSYSIAKANIKQAEYYQLALNDIGRIKILAVMRVWSDEPIPRRQKLADFRIKA